MASKTAKHIKSPSIPMVENTHLPVYQDLSTFRVPANFRGRSGFVVFLWQMIQPTLFACSPQPAYFWRRWILRCFGARVGTGVLVRPTVRITYPWKVTLGDYCWIGDHAEIYSLGEIEIGANSVISQNSYVCAATHDYNDVSFPLLAKKVVIEDEAWIASDCFISPGITIGKAAIVAARSTVLVDVAPRSIVAGTPATRKGWRKENNV